MREQRSGSSFRASLLPAPATDLVGSIHTGLFQKPVWVTDVVRELLFNFLGGIAVLYPMSTCRRKSLFVGYLGGNIKGRSVKVVAFSFEAVPIKRQI